MTTVAREKTLNLSTVREAYKRWAPFYDGSFGLVSSVARRKTVELINQRRGRVLEVGVGTGLSLPNFAPYLKITGIDLSTEMLAKARERVDSAGLLNVEGLLEMDAANLDFPSNSFGTVAAMFVLTVVPDPDKVLAELDRVCAPGGEVILVNHFSQEEGVRGLLEKKLAPFADLIGWHAVFEVDRVLICDDLRLVERRSLWPIGLFTMLRFVKEPGFGVAPQAARDMLAKGRREAPARAPEPIRVRAMRMAGCQMISLCVESGSEKILEALGKSTTPAQTLKATELARRVGLEVLD